MGSMREISFRGILSSIVVSVALVWGKVNFLPMGAPPWAGESGSDTHVWATWFFLRAVGLIYFLGFISYAVQVRGLIGRNGILPAREYLLECKRHLAPRRRFTMPTLCWWSASDRFLLFLCWGGVFLSLLQLVGIAQPVTLLLLWIFYLSLFNVSRLFLGYQWDVLLLETGF